MEAALGETLDFARPACRDIADLHPVVYHRPVELERARDLGLAAEDLDQTLGAVHGGKSKASN